ncbi:galactosyldiacylglycerol synthase [Promineifilum sp.]|uniref:galactosyldiacylglycerol synthase n=1 Tax=Promineifilum sp. TaxID=2664178 RepID=UPI0035B065F7
MIILYNQDSDASLGEISDAQLQFLMDSMEEESTEDQDYYLDENTLDYLIGRGADPALTDLLRAALAGNKHMTIRWERA